MKTQTLVSRNEWLKARLALLDKEKAMSKAREELTRARQALPWVRVDKDYRFAGDDGEQSLADLFGGKDQLIVYHFMFDPEWEEGCKSCSFVADSFERVVVHLAARDVALVAISRAPLENLNAFKKRMGWTFPWVSSFASDFNYDFNVSFTDEQLEKGVTINFRENQEFPMREAPGVSVFAKGDDGAVYHTYSAYSRGLENLIQAYALLDLTPKGRDEDDLSYSMDWLRLRDSYGD